MAGPQDNAEPGLEADLNLDRLPAGRSQLALGGRLQLEDEGGPMRVGLSGELDVDNMDQKVLVHGGFDVEREARCHRCDRPMRLAYGAELEVLVQRNPHSGGEPEDGEEDNWVIRQQGGEVDLAPALAEAVALHEPQHLLCREDCRGLCPRCGIDRNEGECDCVDDELDPRWDALRRLRDAAGED